MLPAEIVTAYSADGASCYITIRTTLGSCFLCRQVESINFLSYIFIFLISPTKIKHFVELMILDYVIYSKITYLNRKAVATDQK